MIEQISTLIMLGLFGLYSVFGVLVWSFAATVEFIAYRRKALDFLTIASSARRTLFTAVVTTLCGFGSLMLWWGYLLSMRHPDFRWLVTCMVFLICLFAILWFITLYVRLHTGRRPYLYLLPQDADDLRLKECKQGIMIAATFYPKIFTDEDIVDTMSRASSVSMRREIFPRHQKQRSLKAMQLTNDFAVYCNVCAEGYTRGYFGFLFAVQSAPDHLESQRIILQEWPETKESEQLMETLAPQFLQAKDAE